MHFRLLTGTALPNAVIALIIVVANLVVLHALTAHGPFLAVTTFLPHLLYAVRALEIAAAVSRLESVRWSFLNYAEFLLTGDTGAAAALRAKQAAVAADTLDLSTAASAATAAARAGCPSYPPSARTSHFFAARAVRIAAAYLAYTTARAASRAHNPFVHLPLLAALDPRRTEVIIGCLAYGVELFALLDLASNVGILGLCMALGCTYVPVMNDPYLSSSLRDFWSRRWNSLGALHRLVFEPVRTFLARIDPVTRPPTTPVSAEVAAATGKPRAARRAAARSAPPTRASPHAIPAAATGVAAEKAAAARALTRARAHASAAAVAAFAVSGLFHEWLARLALARIGPHLPPSAAAAVAALDALPFLAFFAAQAVACAVEAAALRSLRAACGEATSKWLLPVAGRVSLVVGLFAFAPLFMAPVGMS
ncbi:hypothetical protein HK405_014711, partial [Cladochytrium tenue]